MANNGKVYLIGAGPGDPGLLTLKGRDCLARADVIVYDRLADPRILGWSREDAEKIYVGKASSHHTMKQEDICQLLAKLAAEGKTVARLKGGDSFVFGRGGEEALLLREKGLPFEFVPGITSAIAVPEYAGIPVTHRKVAASFAVITGHEDPTRPHSGINWKGLATGVDTLIFLMGVENLKNITARLVENGRPADTPAALVRWGTHPEQRTLVTTLGNAYDDVQKAQLKPPAIFIVGNVVRLRDQLNWFETKPLFGKTFVVTRARAQASSLTKRLEEEGAAVLEVPAIRITDPEDYAPLDNAIDHLAQYRWVLFTSANGVDRFFERLAAHGKDARAFAPCKIGAIGSATADTLDAYGIRADLVPATYKAEDLTEALLPLLQKGDKVLLARAARARNVLPDALRAAGAGVDVVAVYRTAADCGNKDELVAALKNGTVDCVTFTSSSTVTNLLDALGTEKGLLDSVTLAAIGPITAQTCKKQGLFPAVMAEKYTIDGLVEALKGDALHHDRFSYLSSPPPARDGESAQHDPRNFAECQRPDLSALRCSRQKHQDGNRNPERQLPVVRGPCHGGRRRSRRPRHSRRPALRHPFLQRRRRQFRLGRQRTYPELVVITDACFCEYTTHGHCGVLDAKGDVDNDPTLENLKKLAVSQARCGADIIAPSNMMDGYVAAMRQALDEAGYTNVSIMAYSAKFASAYYGPFRAAADSAPDHGDRKGYQMDPCNSDEALREVALDIEEGADIVMVKPAMAYQDVTRRVHDTFNRPLCVYNVSGEYAMIKAAAEKGWIDEERIVMETMLGFKRAGAKMIITYFALEVAKWLKEEK